MDNKIVMEHINLDKYPVPEVYYLISRRGFVCITDPIDVESAVYFSSDMWRAAECPTLEMAQLLKRMVFSHHPEDTGVQIQIVRRID